MRALKKSNEGKLDGELARIANIHKKWTNLVMVPTSVGVLEGVVMTKTTYVPVNGWSSLRPYKIGICRGCHCSFWLGVMSFTPIFFVKRWQRIHSTVE